MYQWKDEPKTEAEQRRLMAASTWVFEQLGPTKFDELQNEYIVYRDSEHAKGKAITPAYIWILNKVQVTVKEC